MNSTEHPSAETLARFASRGLGDQTNEVLEHLVDCSSCARVVLDYRGLLLVPDPESDRAWEDFRGRHDLAFDGPGAGPVHSTPRWRLAAVIALAVLLPLGAVAARNTLALKAARETVAELRLEIASPHINLPTAVALPWTSMRGGNEPVVLDFGESARLGVVRLVLTADPANDDLHLSVIDSGGARVARLDGLHQDADGNVTIAVAREWLSPGRYLLQLGDSGASSQEFAEYALVVRTSGSGAP